MLKSHLMAACLAASTLFVAMPAAAQNYPMDRGGLMEVTQVHIEDGGGVAYAQFLADTWRKNQEFAKSKGWITDYKVYANVHARDGEPDLYLVVYFDKMADAAEMKKRDEAFRQFTQMSDQQMVAASGDRAKMRRIGSSMLLEEMRFK